MNQVIVTLAADTLPGLLPVLRRYGITARRIPLLRFAPPKDCRAFDRVLRQIDRYDAVALTSPRAGWALTRRAARLGIPIEPRSVWAVGKATGRALAGPRSGVRVPGRGRPATAEELVRRLLHARVTSVLFPCGDHRLDVLPQQLRLGGIRVDEVVVYRTLVASPTLIRRAMDGAVAVVGSPTVARAIAAVAGPVVPPLVALGETTAAAARQAGLAVAAVANQPTAPGLLHAIQSALAHFSVQT